MKKTLLMLFALAVICTIFIVGCQIEKASKVHSIAAKLVPMGEKAANDYMNKLVKSGKITEYQKDQIIKLYLKLREKYKGKKQMEKKSETVAADNNMDFGKAIKFLKDGKRVARKGWNGKNMFLWLKPGTEVKSEWCKDPLLKSLADSNGGTIPALGTICMYTHDGTGRRAILTGWLASQTDMLSEDWLVV